MRKKGFYERFLKRPFDLILAIFAIILLSPLLIIIGILVRVKLGSPILFVQERPGKNEKIFKIYKFRTMTSKKDENGQLLPDRLRLTKFGEFLRKTSIDELPELVNICKGDMSFIGPRPLLIEYLPLYNEFQNQRHLVKPGLSGLAQVKGRNTLSWDEKFKLDVEYINNINLFSDLKLMFMTVLKVFKSEDINHGDNETMPRFKGKI